ncbi:hypothetical protein FB107DRAFT_219642 [Schizophyllum commune]
MTLDRDEPAPPIRRSARIQAKQSASPKDVDRPARRIKRKDTAAQDIDTDNDDSESGVSHKRKRQDMNNEEGGSSESKKLHKPLPCDEGNTNTAKPKGKSSKRCVRFADGMPLPSLTNEVDPEEASATAAAAAVKIECLSSRPNESWSNIKEMPIPPEARPHLEPTITRDRKGRLLARYSIRYALVFSFDVEALHRHLQRRRPKYRRLDLSHAMHALVAELQSELGIKFGNGIAYSTVDDKLVYTFFMSKSNRPETLPYPAARIRKFQEIINHPIPPLIVANRPRPVSPIFSVNAPRELTYPLSIVFAGRAPATISPVALFISCTLIFIVVIYHAFHKVRSSSDYKLYVSIGIAR